MKATNPILTIFLLALSQSIFGQVAKTPNQNLFPLYLEIQPDKSAKLSSLKPGDVVEGALTRDVYSADRKVLAAGTHIALTTDRLERQKKEVNGHWPWVVRIFARRHENVPVFKEAKVLKSDGSQDLLQLRFVSIGSRIEISLQSTRSQRKSRQNSEGRGNGWAHHSRRRTSRPLISLEARQESNDISLSAGLVSTLPARSVTLPIGTDCRVLLLNRLSASKNNPGDAVQARLLEPVLQGTQVILPAGSLFEGVVLRAKRPQSLSRAGSLAIKFDRVILPDGAWFPLSASLSGVELSRGSHTKIDAEGTLRGERPGLAWTLINGGVSAGIAKEVDDGTQLVVEAILAGATDASTAGTARIAGTIVSGVFMLTRHGRDVVLPNFTDMDITLNRPLTLFVQVASSSGPSNP